MKKANESTALTAQEMVEKATASTRRAEPHRPYQSPELHEIGSLAKLQAYGYNYRDGSRYQNY